ncbi:MAG: hypothetical protein H6606_06690 [Flavobacteriales bacterium]|nr:hypothetical protein [Flavobacteriales bacterium]
MERNRRIEFIFAILISIAAFAYVFSLALQSPGLEGGMDSYNHYIIARYAWVHPAELLLDQWGKPVYNIIASPFAQFGLMGVVTLNLISWIGCAWLMLFTAFRIGFRFALPAFVFTLGSPIFFDNLISGLTEPLCALILSVCIFLFASKKWSAAAILAGFLPYARSEGFVIMAVFGFYLLFILRNYKAFALLLAGSVIMNCIGWIVESEPFWIFTSNPYIIVQTKKLNLCGSGPLWHYAASLRYTMGKIPLLLFLIGTGLILFQTFRKHSDRTIQFWFYPVLGSYVLYFAVHSAIWYLGVMGSCGYERVLVVIAPLAALIMAYCVELITRWIGNILPPSSVTHRKLIFALLCLPLLYVPVRIYGHKYPIDISAEQKEFVRVAAWYKQQDLQDRMHYFLYPYLNILLDIDPRDTDHFIQLWSFDFDYAPLGSIVIWDGHFGPNECQLPLQELEEHPDFRRIASFIPEKPFKTLNDHDFEVHVFERVGDQQLKK